MIINKRQKRFIEECLIENSFKDDIDYEFYFDNLDDTQKEEFEELK